MILVVIVFSLISGMFRQRFLIHKQVMGEFHLSINYTAC